MCTTCFKTSHLINPESGTTANIRKTDLQFFFRPNGTTYHYEEPIDLKRKSVIDPLCCLNISSMGYMGITVAQESGKDKLFISPPLSDRNITTEVSIDSEWDPRFEIYIDVAGGLYYFIGIDDVRDGFDNPAYKFFLNNNDLMNGGVNIGYNALTQKLSIQGRSVAP